MNDALWAPHEGQQTLALSINEQTYEILYGGARGGGKTDAGIVWLLKGVHDPNFVGMCIRRNHSDLRNWIDRATMLYPNATVTGKPTVFKFPSGAKIYTGHLKDANAYAQFQGWEIHRLLIEEVGQIPTEESYLKLVSSVRSTCAIKPQVFLTCNPGGAGHQWIKKRFQIGRTESNKAFKDPISGRRRVFIPATIDDNPTLSQADPEYVKFLDALPEPLRSAWRYGDFDVFAGQYFAEWEPQTHIIDKEKSVELGFGRPENYKYIGIDWGHSAPFCAVWVEVTPRGRVMAYRELYGTEKHPMEWGELIAKHCQGEEITMSLGDPSMWARNPMSWRKPETAMYTDSCIANALIGNFSTPLVPNLNPANNDRINGWMNLSQKMHWNETTIPDFYVLNGSCPNLVRTIPNMIFDEKRPEDLDTTLEDHALDALRYALTHVQTPTKIEAKSKDQLDYEKLLNPDPEGWNYTWS
mgnify:FL=1